MTDEEQIDSEEKPNPYKGYKNYVAEINLAEKDINVGLSKLKEKLNANENIYGDSAKLTKMLQDYYDKYQALNIAYKSSNVPPSIPVRELDRRQKEIQTFKSNYDRMRKTLDEAKSQKYAFNKQVFNPNEEYKGDERMQGMSNAELKAYQKDKLQDQNKELERINLEAKKGIVLSNEIKATLKDQDAKIDDLGENIDQWDSGMKKVTKKFENYMVGQKTCCLLIILIIEVGAAIAIYFLLKS